jgi:hypothetical protein
MFMMVKGDGPWLSTYEAADGSKITKMNIDLLSLLPQACYRGTSAANGITAAGCLSAAAAPAKETRVRPFGSYQF